MSNNAKPKYHQLSELFKQDILNSVWEEGAKIPAERTLMEKYSVSRNTIRNAISKLVSEGFLFSEVGRGTFVNSSSFWANTAPVINKKKIISLIITDVATNFGKKIVSGAEDTFFDSNYSLVICQTHRNIEKVDKYISNILESGVQGVILDPIEVSNYYEANKQIIGKLEKNNIPVVLIDRKIPLIDKLSITTDNREIAYTVTEKLIDRGFKKIIIIKNNSHIFKNRYQGIMQCIKDHKQLAIDVHTLELDSQEIYEKDLYLICDFIRKHKDEAVVFPLSEYCGHVSMKALQELSLNCPEDISFVSFDHPNDRYFIEGEIAYIEQPLRKMGNEAARSIINLIEKKQYEKKEVIIKSVFHSGKSLKSKSLNIIK